MKSSVFKQEVASGSDYYKAKRWEGKPFACKLKYALAHYPETCFSFAAIALAGPLMLAYVYCTSEDREKYILPKFKSKYTVVRDDDPKVPSILKEKEIIRKFFPC